MVKIPIRCPRCDSNLEMVCYDAPLKVLRMRCWHVCRCGFEESVEKFKKRLLCV